MVAVTKQICTTLQKKGKWHYRYCQLCSMYGKYCENREAINQQEATDKARHDYEQDMKYLHESEVI